VGTNFVGAIVRTQEWAKGFAAGLDATVSAARVTLDELAHGDSFDGAGERELMTRVSANVLKGLEVAVKQIKLLENL